MPSRGVSVAPTGLDDILIKYPGLTPWATILSPLRGCGERGFGVCGVVCVHLCLSVVKKWCCGQHGLKPILRGCGEGGVGVSDFIGGYRWPRIGRLGWLMRLPRRRGLLAMTVGGGNDFEGCRTRDDGGAALGGLGVLAVQIRRSAFYSTVTLGAHCGELTISAQMTILLFQRVGRCVRDGSRRRDIVWQPHRFR